MQIFKFLILFFMLSGCSTVEVAREVTKATTSIRESIEVFNQEKKEEERRIEKEKEVLQVEKKKEKKLINEQKKITEIAFIGKSLDEIISKLGEPMLLRVDGNTKIARFDNNSCRIFLFFSQSKNTNKVEYFEIRDKDGKLIEERRRIEACYKNLV